MIGIAKKEGKIIGIKLSNTLAFTHLLFVDDAILFGLATVEEWTPYKGILDIFCIASGMCISGDKSSFLTNLISDDLGKNIIDLLPYMMELIDKGFKYLGF